MCVCVRVSEAVISVWDGRKQPREKERATYFDEFYDLVTKIIMIGGVIGKWRAIYSRESRIEQGLSLVYRSHAIWNDSRRILGVDNGVFARRYMGLEAKLNRIDDQKPSIGPIDA